MICAVCKKDLPTQRHHISYNPAILIDLCLECHEYVHGFEHGTGSLPKMLERNLKMARSPEDRKLEELSHYPDVYTYPDDSCQPVKKSLSYHLDRVYSVIDEMQGNDSIRDIEIFNKLEAEGLKEPIINKLLVTLIRDERICSTIPGCYKTIK